MAEDPNPEHERIRRQRNIVMALALGAFVVLVYYISIAKMM
jgi:hypothetical protein